MTLPRSRPAGPGVPGSSDSGSGPDVGLDDRTLIARVTEGDGRALEALYARYGRACYGLARRILADDQFAQDCVQEVFLTVWRDASRFDAARGGFSTWLLSMTHHKAVDAVRREENLRKRRTGADALEHRESDAPPVEDAVWSGMRGDRVRAALLTLPEPQREALTLAYFGGYTQREIAGLTATPLGTVKTRMLTGMRRLRGHLDGLGRDAAGTPGTVS
ncbi:MAG TPA: sigma-70 family RNA polymerase sigma factor [Mycobacteriales bacterium]|nr:sigma-70 family RNA polymerase sigma factor [Mycobacteriales bacterium]